jgi:glycosyltransferase involved in cell wall biosynthesis
VIVQTNGGSHAAINAGLSVAKGDYLAIINSDDVFERSRIARLYRLAEAENLEFLCTGVSLIDEHSRKIVAPDHWWLAMYDQLQRQYRELGNRTLLFGNFTISTSNFFFRRSLFEALGRFRPYRYVLDWDYALGAFRHSPRGFTFLADEPLLRYRLHGRNTILSGSIRGALEVNDLYRRWLLDSYEDIRLPLVRMLNNQRFLRRELNLRHDRRLQQEIANHRATAEAFSNQVQRLQDALARSAAEIDMYRSSPSFRLGRALTAPYRFLRRSVGGG